MRRRFFIAVGKAYNERKTADASTRSSNWQAVKDALAAGGNPRAGGYSSKLVTSLMFLAYDLPNADDATVQQIIAHSDLNAQEQDFGATALHVAAEGSNSKMLGWLIKAGADLNVLSKNKQTPLDLALSQNRPDAIAVLRKAGATENPLAIDTHGATKLISLVQQKPFDSAKATALLKAGVDVNAVNKAQESALILAAKSSMSDAVNFLLINGARPNFADSIGNTALIYGAGLGSGDDALAIVKALIAVGADINLKNNAGKTAFVIADGSFNSRAASELEKAGAKIESSTGTATTTPTTSRPSSSLDNTKLMNAAIKKPFDTVAVASLLKAGEKVDATNFADETALMMAASVSSPDAVKFLIANGAKVDLVDSKGQSALMNGAALSSSDDALVF